MDVRRVLIADLVGDPGNVRTHDDRNISAIAASLKRFGQQKPIVIDSKNVVRAGNGTLAAAKQLGWDSISVVVTDLDGADAVAFAIADNRTAELANWDNELLRRSLEELKSDQELYAACGFTDDELGEMYRDDELNGVGEDQVPDLPLEPITKPGDIFSLGNHRLICGDSTDLAVLERLFGEALASMCFTDPPYNVAYEGKTADALTIENDEMDDDSFLQFLRDVFSGVHAFLRDGSVVYVCHADIEAANFIKAFTDAGLLYKQCVIWLKNTLVLGRKDYHSKHEPILYGWKPGRHRFYAGRKQTTAWDEMDGICITDAGDGHVIQATVNGKTFAVKVPSFEILASGDDQETTVWNFKKPHRNAEHPTMKPVELCARAISHASKRGEIVFDPFLGSGSTLIASEQLSRICYGCELDPKYCDVIVKRWENLTGKKARLANGDS